LTVTRPARSYLPIAALALLAIALTAAYAAALGPDPEPRRDDQVQYLALARGLIERGEFTRAGAGEPFVPEPLRFPGYPLLLAAVCRTVGCERIVAVQAVLLALAVVLTVRFGAPVLGGRRALAAGALVAAYPTFAYFAALTVSEIAATVLLAGACVAFVAMAERPAAPRALVAGALLGALALTRPFFLPLPLLLAALALASRRRSARPLAPALLLTIAAFGAVLAPQVAYSLTSFGRPLVGSLGTQLWLGYFQGLAPADLDDFQRAEADAGRAAIARLENAADRRTQSYAFVALDDELRARALALMAHDPLGYLARGAVRSVVLWAGEVPARDAGATLPDAVRSAWLALELSFLGVGLVGSVRLARRGDLRALVPLALVLFVWALSFPLWAEGRFSLPAKPLLAIGVVAALSAPRPGGPSEARPGGRAARGGASRP